MVELLLILVGLVVLLICVMIYENENEIDKNYDMNRICYLESINRKLNADLLEIRKHYARKY